jgi:hypothetical protein
MLSKQYHKKRNKVHWSLNNNTTTAATTNWKYYFHRMSIVLLPNKNIPMMIVIQLFMILMMIYLIMNCIQMRTMHLDFIHNHSSISSSSSAYNTIRSTGNMNAIRMDHEDSLVIDTVNVLQQEQQQQQEQRIQVQDISRSNLHTIYRTIPQRNPYIQTDIVQAGDYIYYNDIERWDAAPIVIETHKLIFFTIPKVGCTIWKQLFRRMMGYTDWMSQNYDVYQPHNPSVNGLKYLYNYTIEEASIMMTSPEWTRAIMVRDPKQRFLSAFLDKSVGNFHTHIKDRCCTIGYENDTDGSNLCVENAQTIAGFLQLCYKCYDDHWRPQSIRVDCKYWPYIDHVSHVETAAIDAQSLLMKINAWEEYGATGWGSNGLYPIFASRESNGSGMNHSTRAEEQIWKWYTPETEQLVEQFYQGDYENPLFQFRRNECLTCIT